MSKKKATAISLPLSRTAKIMTSAVGVESVNQDIVALATKATEIFLMDFARRAYDQSSDEEFRSNVLEYDDIQKLVHSDSRYDFLIDTTPKRIKFSEALRLVEETKSKAELAAAERNDKNNSNKNIDSDSEHDNHNHTKTKEGGKNQMVAPKDETTTEPEEKSEDENAEPEDGDEIGDDVEEDEEDVEEDEEEMRKEEREHDDGHDSSH